MHRAEENSVTQGSRRKEEMGNGNGNGNVKDDGGEHLKQNIFGLQKHRSTTRNRAAVQPKHHNRTNDQHP